MLKREVAIQVIETSRKSIAVLDSLVAEIRDDCEAEDFERIRRGVGLSIVKILDELLEPVYSQYPELDPDK